MTTLRPGMKIWNTRLGSASHGTIGAILISTQDPSRRFLITCAHVLGAGNASPGDQVLVEIEGQHVEVGVLRASGPHVPDYYREDDVAIAEITADGIGVSAEIIPGKPLSGISHFVVPNVNLFAKGGDDDGFENAIVHSGDQRRIVVIPSNRERFGNPGDSGAIAINKFGCAVGMIQSREKHENKSNLIPIRSVLRSAESLTKKGTGSLKLLTRPPYQNLGETNVA